MTATVASRTVAPTEVRRPGFGAVLRAEWVKFWTVRSTSWTLGALFGLGAGLTVLICATSAAWLASAEADESAGAFITWGMMIAPVPAVVLGTLIVTSEYGTGMIRATLAAVPRRGPLLAAKTLVVGGTLLVAGIVTAVVGYLGGNAFLAAEGVGLSLGDEGVLRALLGSGVYLAGLGLLAMAIGLLVRHTAATLAIVLGLVFVVGNMAFLLPGTWGEWIAKALPGNAGSVLSTPVSFNPNLLEPGPGFVVFAVQTVLLLAVGWATFHRRDA